MAIDPGIFNGSAYVVRQEKLAPNCLRMTLAVPLKGDVPAGTFAHILCDEGATDPLLRRPFSFWDVKPQKKALTNVDIVYTVVGKGTEILAKKKPLDTVGFLGPVGRGFTIRKDRPIYLFVAGGVGIVPFYHFARQIRESGHDCDIRLLFGARNESMLYGMDDFADHGVKALAATDDGSRGLKGLVSELLVRELDALDGSKVMIYTCGPDRMMDRVIRIAREYSLPCEVSMERRMGCALGACGACVTKVADGNDWRYSRICWEGPAYDSSCLVLD